jgi:hypothetical protein
LDFLERQDFGSNSRSALRNALRDETNDKIPGMLMHFGNFYEVKRKWDRSKPIHPYGIPHFGVLFVADYLA